MINPDLKQHKRVGGWRLEWHPSRLNTCWVIPEYLKTFRRCESAIMYDNGTLGWDIGGVPQYVQRKVVAFIIECQQQHNTTTEKEAV